MKQYIVDLIAIVAFFCSASCSSDQETNSKDKLDISNTPHIIFDSDIVSSTDDLVALRALYGYMDAGRCELLGIVVDREGESNAACADIFNTFYNHPDIPIGLVRSGVRDATVWNDYSGIAEWTDADGNLLFKHTIDDYSTLPDGYELYRELLGEASDKSVTIVSVGFVTAIAQLLESEGGRQLVADKVKALYIMGGKFVPGSPDYNFAQGPEFAKTFFHLWPKDTPVYFSPSEVGNAIYYDGKQLLADMAEVEIDPLKEIYLRNGNDDTQMMWDPLAVIHAVEGDEWFDLSEWGYVTVDSEGYTTFTASPAGCHRYQLPGNAAWNAATLDKIRNLIK